MQGSGICIICSPRIAACEAILPKNMHLIKIYYNKLILSHRQNFKYDYLLSGYLEDLMRHVEKNTFKYP